MEIYNTPIYILVQSKHDYILKEFLSTFEPTTSKFNSLHLAIENGKEFGAPVINKHVNEARMSGEIYFGVFNDDIWFSEGWLEDTLRLLNDHHVVSAGYVETQDKDKFSKAVEATKNETGFAKHLYGPNAIFRYELFRQIGKFDERFDWSCDDLDWAVRLQLNNRSSVTSKKVTVAHWVGVSRGVNSKQWNQISEINKQRFYDKHGYVSYREIRREYKENHQYFRQFK